MNFGLYEQLINKALSEIDESQVQIEKVKLDSEKAPKILAKYFSEVLEKCLKDLKENNYSTEEQLEFCNCLISKLKEKTNDNFYDEQKIVGDEIIYSLLDKKDSIRGSNI